MFDRKKVRWDFFCDFQTLWYPLFNVFNAVLRQKLKSEPRSHIHFGECHATSISFENLEIDLKKCQDS